MNFTQTRATFVKLSMIVLAVAAVGCEPQTKPAPNDAASASDHGHGEHDHVHPETLADAVKQLEGACAEVKAAFAKDDAEAAHEPMHDVAHLIEQIPALLKKSSLDAAAQEEVTKAAESLFNAIGDVDKGMHGGDGKKYSEVADTVEASLKVLSEKAKS